MTGDGRGWQVGGAGGIHHRSLGKWVIYDRARSYWISIIPGLGHGWVANLMVPARPYTSVAFAIQKPAGLLVYGIDTTIIVLGAHITGNTVRWVTSES